VLKEDGVAPLRAARWLVLVNPDRLRRRTP